MVGCLVVWGVGCLVVWFRSLGVWEFRSLDITLANYGHSCSHQSGGQVFDSEFGKFNQKPVPLIGENLSPWLVASWLVAPWLVLRLSCLLLYYSNIRDERQVGSSIHSVPSLLSTKGRVVIGFCGAIPIAFGWADIHKICPYGKKRHLRIDRRENQYP